MKKYIPLYEAHDYKLRHEAPTNDGYAKPLYDLTNIYPDDIYSVEGARYYGDGSSFDNESINIIRRYKDKPNKPLTIYRAVPKILTNQEKIEINKGDWISINKKYAMFHGKTHLDNYKIISKQVKAKEIYTDGNSIHEWGYDPS